ncbi:gluconokinase [Vagococcus sp.]|uniref:gluconokinase n=1 Tax=Vagococcus sp. TaxID=1933889 RepID=UPI002FC8A761
MGLLLAVDIGTTAIKYRVEEANNNRTLLSKSTRITTYLVGAYATQNPTKILEQLKKDIVEISRNYSNIDTIALSTAMHTLIPVEQEQLPQEMFLWSDNRSAKVIDDFKQDKEKSRLFYQKTGTPIHPMSPFAKLLYFRLSEEAWYQRVTEWLDIKSLISRELTGETVVDYSVASATGIFNSHQLEWDQEILSFLMLDEKKLAKVVHPKTRLVLKQEMIEKLGVSVECELLIGASDGCMVALGSFNQTKSPLTITLGTSGAVRLLSSVRTLSSEENTFCYYLDEEQWVIGGPTNNGGRVFEWLSELFYEDKETLFSKLSDLPQVPYLVFMPYLQGERAPLWDSSQTGTFYGLTLQHKQPEMIQAVIEGVIFNLFYIFNQLSFSEKENTLVLSGGVFNNQVITQMVADIFQKKCYVSSQTEPTQGLKDWCFLVEINEIDGEYYEPSKLKKEYYEEKYELFCKYLHTPVCCKP